MFYVVGDIEDSVKSYNDALNLVDKQKYKVPIVFLGDIYTPTDPHGSIQRIEVLLGKFGIICHEFFAPNNEDNLEQCARFQKIMNDTWSALCMDIYSNSNKIRTIEKQDMLKATIQRSIINSTVYATLNAPVFLFGNKEIDILRDLKNLNALSINNNEISGKFAYSAKNKKYETEIKFTFNEMNILLSYLMQCVHACFLNKILLSHIYLNAKNLIKARIVPSTQTVISGHNRAYGRFVDDELPNVDIYLIDISHEKEDLMKNYLTVSPCGNIEFVSHNPDIKLMEKKTMNVGETFLKSNWDVVYKDMTIYQYFVKYILKRYDGNQNSRIISRNDMCKTVSTQTQAYVDKPDVKKEEMNEQEVKAPTLQKNKKYTRFNANFKPSVKANGKNPLKPSFVHSSVQNNNEQNTSKNEEHYYRRTNPVKFNYTRISSKKFDYTRRRNSNVFITISKRD